MTTKNNPMAKEAANPWYRYLTWGVVGVLTGLLVGLGVASLFGWTGERDQTLVVVVVSALIGAAVGIAISWTYARNQGVKPAGTDLPETREPIKETDPER
jgi:hypothetical protein